MKVGAHGLSIFEMRSIAANEERLHVKTYKRLHHQLVTATLESQILEFQPLLTIPDPGIDDIPILVFRKIFTKKIPQLILS